MQCIQAPYAFRFTYHGAPTMEAIDFRRFISGGYFLIQAGNPGWEQLKTELLPEKLISLAPCISQRLDISWGWNPERKMAALQFGVREASWDEFMTWCGQEYRVDMDRWSMFYSPDAARRIAKRFVGELADLHLIGVGLSLELEESNWREPAPDPEVYGEVYGIEKRIEQRLPLVEAGQPLGFEVVSFELGDFGHSWLCRYFHFEMHHLFGIQPGQYGLLRSEQDARRVYEWIEEDESGQRSEHMPHDYWLLVEYPLDPMAG